MSDDDKRTERRGLSTQNIIIIAVVCGLAVALVIAAIVYNRPRPGDTVGDSIRRGVVEGAAEAVAGSMISKAIR